jgi:hypothetical protein
MCEIGLTLAQSFVEIRMPATRRIDQLRAGAEGDVILDGLLRVGAPS